MLGATPKQHPLAAKMRMAHHRIERNMKCDNRSVRKRNQKEVATMMTGIKATAYAAFNLAELHYHGAPGIAPDMKLTLHLYVCTMEAEDAAQTFAGARDFLNHYVFNLMGILDQCSLEAVEPVAARLDDACYVHNQTSDWPAEFKLAAAGGRGRFAYLQGRAEDATKEWETVATMSGQLQHRPMLHTYVGKAEYHLAKLKAEQADDTAAPGRRRDDPREVAGSAQADPPGVCAEAAELVVGAAAGDGAFGPRRRQDARQDHERRGDGRADRQDEDVGDVVRCCEVGSRLMRHHVEFKSRSRSRARPPKESSARRDSAFSTALQATSICSTTAKQISTATRKRAAFAA